MAKNRLLLAAAAVAASSALLLSGCASTDATSTGTATEEAGSAVYNTGNIKDFCPDTPTKVGYAKGSNNTWTKTVLAELTKAAEQCSNITEVIFTDAKGDQQKAISDVDSLVAQGVQVLIVQPEFGAAQLPSIQAATDAGVKVVSFISDPGGTPGTDYVTFVNHDVKYIGEQQAAFFNKALNGKGKIVFLGGTPGAASSVTFFDAFKEALKAYPGLSLVEDNFVVTNWDPGEKKKVMTALLAKYGRIDGVVSDYTTTDTGVIDAYTEAGVALPALAGQASANVNGCQWEKSNFAFFTLDGTTTTVEIALRKALAAYVGKDNPEPSRPQLPIFIDTTSGKNPKCSTVLPPDADLSSSLTEAELKKMLG
ncbi:ribose transport system substrate-binding protein [Aurantimicrobium minutum]|uniref:substrate-binding domain-containing protein n=1 Tax=Aurantimicrobium minutum TaxID=708131 RepID=UPI0024769180|nr:substrate-binding domain-containing protein [Aurantimicrobium minutum]MDH6277812.1 ribose transport system substrate-binding protein [Aurantimicrobium minutum]